jgi:hypothetical protein
MKNDILNGIVDLNKTEFIEADDFEKLLEDTTIVDNNILFINHAIPLETVLKVVKRINPIFIFHLSDEYGTMKDWMQFSEHTKILFRQYNFNDYDMKSYTNIIQIPIGYVSGYLNGKSSLTDKPPKKITDRTYECSFVGQAKSDTAYMCELFEKNMKNTYIKLVDNSWKIKDLSVSPKEMFNIYSDSIFVPIGRGNSSIECFRIYEAIIAGAIPIIVDDKDEAEDTFYYNDSTLPPFLIFKTWEDAVEKCKRLLDNPNELQGLQDKNIKWWNEKIEYIRENIINVMDQRL